MLYNVIGGRVMEYDSNTDSITLHHEITTETKAFVYTVLLTSTKYFFFKFLKKIKKLAIM